MANKSRCIVYARRYCSNPPSCALVNTMALNAQISCHTILNDSQSICDLPCADYVRVFWTVKSSFIGQINDTRAEFEALEAIGCLSNGMSQCSLISRPKHVVCRAAFRSFSYLKHFLLVARLIEPFDRRTACPFARTSTVTDNELAYGIVASIGAVFGWYENTTVDWHSVSTSYDVSRSTICIEVLDT